MRTFHCEVWQNQRKTFKLKNFIHSLTQKIARLIYFKFWIFFQSFKSLSLTKSIINFKIYNKNTTLMRKVIFLKKVAKALNLLLMMHFWLSEDFNFSFVTEASFIRNLKPRLTTLFCDRFKQGCQTGGPRLVQCSPQNTDNFLKNIEILRLFRKMLFVYWSNWCKKKQKSISS